jgi:hypothetical protein
MCTISVQYTHIIKTAHSIFLSLATSLYGVAFLYAWQFFICMRQVGLGWLFNIIYLSPCLSVEYITLYVSLPPLPLLLWVGGYILCLYAYLLPPLLLLLPLVLLWAIRF